MTFYELALNNNGAENDLFFNEFSGSYFYENIKIPPYPSQRLHRIFKSFWIKIGISFDSW